MPHNVLAPIVTEVHDHSKPSMLLKLPREIHNHIFGYLAGTERSQVALTCHQSLELVYEYLDDYAHVASLKADFELPRSIFPYDNEIWPMKKT